MAEDGNASRPDNESNGSPLVIGDGVDGTQTPHSEASGSTENLQSSSQDFLQVRGSLRSTGSKIANLRAQFEKDKADDMPRSLKRAVSSDQVPRHELEGEILALKKQLKQEAELRMVYEEKCASLEQDFDFKQTQGVGTSEAGMSLMESNGQNENKDQFIAAEREARKEIVTLRQQLADLKRSISMSTRIESQVTDSSFSQEMEYLHHEVQNWVVINFRKAKGDLPVRDLSACLQDLPSTYHPEALQKLYEAFSPATKLATYQATVSTCLLDIFAERFLYGLKNEYTWYMQVCEAAKSLPEVLTAVSYNKWRAVSFDQVRQCNAIENDVSESAAQLAERICDILCTVTEIEENEARKASLTGIVKRAIALAHLFRVQRPQYDFALPHPGTPFDASFMDDAEADGQVQSGVVRCSTWPAVTKIGDEQGDNLHLRQLVIKAKVICCET